MRDGMTKNHVFILEISVYACYDVHFFFNYRTTTIPSRTSCFPIQINLEQQRNIKI